MQNFDFKGTEAEGLIEDVMDIVAGREHSRIGWLITALADSILTSCWYLHNGSCTSVHNWYGRCLDVYNVLLLR
jgi:hypothetical protein